MSEGVTFVLLAACVAGAGIGLYLLIRLICWLGSRWCARAHRRAEQHGEHVVDRLTAQLGRSTDTAASTGMTRLRRRGTPDAATPETVLRSVFHKLGMDMDTTVTLPTIREPHPENARGDHQTVPPDDLVISTGSYQPVPLRRHRHAEQCRPGSGGHGGPVHPTTPSRVAVCPPHAGGGEWPTPWAASA